MLTAFTVIQLKRGNAADLLALNPQPEPGEIIVELDTGRFKIGDGVRRWNSLLYANGGGAAGSIIINDVAGLQQILDGKQPIGAYALTSDARFSDARAPLAHLHSISNIEQLQIVLDSKQPAGDYVTSAHTHVVGDVTNLQASLDAKQAAGNYVLSDDARLTDSREWSAATATQAEAEAGTSTSRLAFTPLRVFQAIAAWWAASSAKTKLDGIATGATANSSDATLLSRANHTGTQAAGTITGLAAAVAAAAPVQSINGQTGAVTTDTILNPFLLGGM